MKKQTKTKKIFWAFLTFSIISSTVSLIGIPRASAGNYGEADLGCGMKDVTGKCLGPEINVGLWSLSKNDLKKNSFKIKATKDFVVRDKDRKALVNIPAGKTVKVKYLSEDKLRIYGDGFSEIKVNPKKLYFQPRREKEESEIIFDVNRPDSRFDQYRGEIALRLYDVKGNDNDRFWVINYIPLEQYIWGMGEMKGTGDDDHSRVMTTIFRTYGYWKVKFSTKYAKQGFHVDATSGSQIYNGYDWEEDYPKIRKAAKDTRGRIIMYNKEIALTPYGSWTDGKTRYYLDGHWGGKCQNKQGKKVSSDFPWLRSVSDSYGKNKDMSTCELATRGNHMVGLSARGSLKLAGDKGWKWDKIIKYYFYKITIRGIY